MSHHWDTIWDRKGDESADAIELSGFEHFSTVDTADCARQLMSLLGIKSNESVLEVGCAGGLLARELAPLCRYVGSDRSESVVKKTIAINGLSVVACAADDLIFKDKSFDYVFAFTVFHYFPDHDYARRAIAEMKRVARNGICVSDLPVKSADPTHLLFEPAFFAGWQISPGLYDRNNERFTACLKLPK